MLKALRQGSVGQVLMAGIVFAIIAVFLLEFRATSRMQTASLKTECAVRIGSDCLLPREYTAEFGLVVPRGLSAKQLKAFQLRKAVMDGLIERELLAAEATRLGLSVDEESVKRELRLGRAHVSLPAANTLRLGSMLDLVAGDDSGISRDLVRELPVFNAKTGEVDDDLYARVVRSMTNRSPKEFLKMQQRELLAARMRDIVRSNVRVSEEEAFDAFVRERSRAVVRSVLVDPTWFTRWTADVSDAATDRWATEHKAEVDEAWKTASAGWTAGCTLVSDVVASLQADATEADKTLQKDRIDQAKALLADGAAFEVVARQLSDGPTASLGGRVGCVSKETFGDSAEAIAKATKDARPGTVTGIVTTPGGFHVLRVEGTLAAADVESVGRRAVARPLAARADASNRARAFAAQLIEAAKGGARLDDTIAKLLPELAAAYAPRPKAGAKKDEPAPESAPLRDPRAPKMEISAPFSADGEPVPGAFGVPLARMAFELAKADDVHPEPIAVGPGFLVLQLKEKTTATREEFATAKAEFLKRIEIGKRADALTRYVARLRQAKADKIQIGENLLEEKGGDQDG